MPEPSAKDVERAARLKGAGGTSGGIGQFFVGAAMLVIGGYLLLEQVTVTSGMWRIYGYNAFGISLIPLLFGVAMLFFNGRSIPGWGLTLAGSLIIFAGIIANMHIYFRPTSLFNTLVMLILIAGGVGMVARSLREQPSPAERKSSGTG